MIDGFTFNGEISAEVHLNATARFFDVIVIVEAWDAHQAGMPRKSQLYIRTPYWQRVFARFGSKIRLVVVCCVPPPPPQPLRCLLPPVLPLFASLATIVLMALYSSSRVGCV
jgi:hypothetical protein